MKKSLLLIILLLVGCGGMSNEEFKSRIAYCDSIGATASPLLLHDGWVDKVRCIDEEGNKFESKVLEDE